MTKMTDVSTRHNPSILVVSDAIEEALAEYSAIHRIDRESAKEVERVVWQFFEFVKKGESGEGGSY